MSIMADINGGYFRKISCKKIGIPLIADYKFTGNIYNEVIVCMEKDMHHYK